MIRASNSLWLLAFIFWFTLSSQLRAQEQADAAQATPAAATKILVAAAPCPPFVISEGGKLSGLGIYLWDNVAKQMGAEYEIFEAPLGEMLTAISQEGSQRGADVGISCLSITAEREKFIDFSHSFHETYTGIAVKQRGLLDMVKGFVTSPAIWGALTFVLLVAAFVGAVFFLLERKLTPKLYSMEGPVGRITEAFMVGLLFVTQGPIKFYEFKTMAARFLAAIMALSSTFLIAGVTAVLASAFTLDGLRSQVTSLQDLQRVRVAALQDSTSSEFLRNNGIAHQTREDLQAMMDELERGGLDAIVSDAAFLKYSIQQGRTEGKYKTLSVLPYEFDSQNYGFAMQRKSDIDEEVNQALLIVRKTPEWRSEVLKYLGE